MFKLSFFNHKRFTLCNNLFDFENNEDAGIKMEML